MRTPPWRWLALGLMALLPAAPALAMPAAAPPATPVVQHDISAVIDPATHGLRVRDRLRIPAALVHAQLGFSLNAALKVQPLAGAVSVRQVQARAPRHDTGIESDDGDATVAVNVYRLPGAAPGRDLVVELAYEGRIDHPPRQSGATYARGQAKSPGLIEDRGVVLTGSTFWVPHVGTALLTYTLRTELPAGWKTVSQGERTTATPADAGTVRETWKVDTPTEEVHLIAARFTEYSRDAGGVQAMSFLRQSDAALAERYLQATAQYLGMYSELLGPYPYSKFALVENFWDTGYGMPSFTLLGAQVIRLPFILHSSYPHELLHNWWGNGVFVDPAGGNWCEGLTAYLADHLIAEQRGQGAEHRRDILQRVTDYVAAEDDFPLARFRGRVDAVTEAIGYGKAAMVWNMLRGKTGDAGFVAALRKFYADQRFRAAGYDDIRVAFEAVTWQDFRPFFHQWITQTGTPELRLDAAQARGNRLQLTLSQVQRGPLMDIDVPVVVQTAAGVETRQVAMSSQQAQTQVTLELPAAALRVEVDPQFQVYRRLGALESPPTLSKMFGAKQVLVVTPAAGAPIWAGLLKAWVQDGVETVRDDQLDALPIDRAVWVLGAANRYAPLVADALKTSIAGLDPDALHVGDTIDAPDGRSRVAVVRQPQNPLAYVAWVSATSEAAATALARKLPHYGKYAWLVFAGDEANNEAKGVWTARDTPLARNLVPGAGSIGMAPRKALAEVRPMFDSTRPKTDLD